MSHAENNPRRMHFPVVAYPRGANTDGNGRTGSSSARKGDQAGANSSLMRRPSAAAALAMVVKVVKVRLVSISFSNRLSEARLVRIFLPWPLW